MAAEPAEAPPLFVEVFSGVEQTGRPPGNIRGIAVTVRIVSQGRRPVLDSQVLFRRGVDFDDLGHQPHLGRLRHIQHIDDVGIGTPPLGCGAFLSSRLSGGRAAAPAAQIHLGHLDGGIVFILVLDPAPEQDLAVHHLHLDLRIADGFLDGLGRPCITAGDKYIVFFPAVVAPHQKSGRTGLFPHQ